MYFVNNESYVSLVITRISSIRLHISRPEALLSLPPKPFTLHCKTIQHVLYTPRIPHTHLHSQVLSQIFLCSPSIPFPTHPMHVLPRLSCESGGSPCVEPRATKTGWLLNYVTVKS